MSFPARLIVLEYSTFSVPAGEAFRRVVRRDPTWQIGDRDDVAIWCSVGVSTDQVRRGRLVAIGQIDKILAVGAGQLIVYGYGLASWWIAQLLEAYALHELVPSQGGPAREVSRRAWNELLRLDAMGIPALARDFEPWQVEEQAISVEPPPAAHVQRRPRRHQAGPIERSVIRASARGNYWRPGRGKWR